MALLPLITSPDDGVRNQSLDAACEKLTSAELLAEAEALDTFRRTSGNLYHRVRALLFLYSIHRFHLPRRFAAEISTIPFKGYENLLERRFEEAIDVFLKAQQTDGPGDAISSALASTYHRLAFQTLADQVRRSVRSVSGNQWMFRMGHPADQPLRIRPEIALRDPATGTYPILRERTPVRMDLTHCGWSDIFFLGMDYPEGAKVLNISIDLAVHGRNQPPSPPVEASLRVIEEPILRLTSVDLGCSAEISSLNEVFDFAKDYLGLLKAAVIASGIVPPGIEGSGQSLADLLARIVGPGKGLELVSNVNNIPKGSRLAVSTNLLAALIGVCMRATGQARSLTGPLEEGERRIVLARALLGEWIGGSGGGWQDSGGVWPGMKLIQGTFAGEGDPEHGISRGRLMPTHTILDLEAVPAGARQKLQDSLVLVHGALKVGDIAAIGAATTANFRGPIQTIIPWASNLYTETLIEKIEAEFGSDFRGFWMLGGMAGGGMGFIFTPEKKADGQRRLQAIMSETKAMLESALPFAMEPVVYDFAINERGTWADLLTGSDALMPAGYYSYIVPQLLRKGRHELTPLRLAELDHFATACRDHPELRGMVQTLFDSIFPRGPAARRNGGSLAEILAAHGFDRAAHEQIRTDLKAGRIGLAQNRLPANAIIEDVLETDLTQSSAISAATREIGMTALRNGEVAVITLAAGAGSRWTQGAGVVKALHPFCKLGGRHRSFIETHLAKSRKTGREAGTPVPHIFTTSYFSHEPTERFLSHYGNYDYVGPLYLSQGKAIGLRTVPTVRDLRFAWEEMPQQVLDVQQQKVRDSLRGALLHWAESTGEASDYTDNLPLQCLHPVGHWYEVPNLLRNGILAALLAERPQLQTLVLHNIDTVGMNLDPALLGHHLASGAGLSFEVITRRLEDRGGGLARVNGVPQLVEGLAMPREEDEFNLSYYNSNTCWIQIDALLDSFHLTRADLTDLDTVNTAIRTLARKTFFPSASLKNSGWT